MSTKIPNLASGVSRRQFINTTAAAAAGVALASRVALAQSPSASSAGSYAQSLLASYGRPNSKFNGVQIGVIAPYSFGNGSAEELLKYCVALGINAVELQGGPVETYIGTGGGGGRGGLPGATPAQQAAVNAINATLQPLTQAVTAARADLTGASLRGGSRDEIVAKADAVAKAELALALGRADAAAKLQASAEKLNQEQFASFMQQNGGPAPAGGRGGGRGGAPAAGGAPTLAVSQAPLAPWMTAATLAKVAELGRMYRDAGVSIYGFKRGGPTDSDAQLDYNFEMAKAIGAHHITLELPTNPLATERMGAFGAKHRIYVGYHTHTQARFDSFDEALRQSAYNAINVDVGHFQGGNKTSVLPMLRKYPDRVASIHLKDKSNSDVNMMWGQGDTPLIEILQTMRQEKWTFPATIEFEYGGQMPAGSNRLVEIGRCRAYCAAALLS